QHRLVAAFAGGGLRADLADAAALASVPARNHPRSPAALAQVTDQCQDRGGLAGTSGDHIANHDHGHRETLDLHPAQAERELAQHHQRAVDGGQGTASPGRPPALQRLGLPSGMAVRLVHGQGLRGAGLGCADLKA
ncbi:hypothetical protein RZS08_24985, partial [Arthrospira platensis SPKY1]|nr:hypothetical protein [Arthrospira platensis SPKY1]